MAEGCIRGSIYDKLSLQSIYNEDIWIRKKWVRDNLFYIKNVNKNRQNSQDYEAGCSLKTLKTQILLHHTLKKPGKPVMHPP